MRTQTQGEDAVNSYLKSHVRILQHLKKPDSKDAKRSFSLKARPGQYGTIISNEINALKKLAQDRGHTVRDNKLLIVNILDHIVTSHISEVHADDAICVSSQMCHAVGTGPRTASLVILPTVHAENTDQQCVKQSRRLEDALLAQKMNLGLRASFKFTDMDLHKNTRKPLTNWVLLAVSDPLTNTFGTSNLARGKTTDSTLINARDMVVLEDV
eukprot:5344386-Karenia_brevis.AAC.1